LRATDPRLTKQALEKLVIKTERRPILIIAIAHGGLIAGMDLFLRYMDINPESVFYPIRFSNRKYKDKEPRIESTEKTALSIEAKSRDIVIFDEDVSSGTTLKKTGIFFEGLFGKKPILAANLAVPFPELVYGEEINFEL